MPDSPKRKDWKAIMLASDKDGTGKIALETHIFDGTLMPPRH